MTVKAAPNPSAHYGETVCVAGVSLDAVGHLDWVRLYPINFRVLEDSVQFRKYSIVEVDCVAAVQDQRVESWRPRIESMVETGFLRDWGSRREWVEPLMSKDMCGLWRAAARDSSSASLGLIRPREIADFIVTPHPGWSAEEQAKIDGYVSQLELFPSGDRTPLEAPAFRGHFHWTCWADGCRGHKMELIDWEFVAHQRNLRSSSPDEAVRALRRRWLEEVCGPDRAPAFFVGNQAKRHQTFSILGVWWPKASSAARPRRRSW